ncbi:hypothetical protein E4T39_01901 [Aureobasidium subglaciale]|nr:hypothetical protein E4T39_01901 [Aureobasidium subglaciale]
MASANEKAVSSFTLAYCRFSKTARWLLLPHQPSLLLSLYSSSYNSLNHRPSSETLSLFESVHTSRTITPLHISPITMAVISPSVKAHVNRKQLKNVYRMPRSLKKAIEKNVKKIVKKHERKLREVEGRKVAIDIEARSFQTRGYLDAFDHVIQTFDMNDDLAMALDALLTRCIHNTESAIGRQKAGLLGKKAFAKKVLEGGYVTEEIKEEMLVWKGEGKDTEEERGSESAE